VAAAGDNIIQAGYLTGNPLVHGWGLSVEPGFHVGAREHPAYWPTPSFSFPRDACVTVEPNPCTRDMQAGATAGAMVLVEDGGVRQFHAIPERGLVAL
jgi:hypothetical protein